MNDNDVKIDRWQVRGTSWSVDDTHPSDDLRCREGYEPAGPWFPFAQDTDGVARRRPLRRVSVDKS